MNLRDVPIELVALASARFTDTPVEPDVEWIPMRRALAAVWPEIERQVRERVAAEIEAERSGSVWDETDFSGDGQHWDMAMDHAARIARGEP